MQATNAVGYGLDQVQVMLIDLNGLRIVPTYFCYSLTPNPYLRLPVCFQPFAISCLVVYEHFRADGVISPFEQHFECCLFGL